MVTVVGRRARGLFHFLFFERAGGDWQEQGAGQTATQLFNVGRRVHARSIRTGAFH